MGPNRFHVGGLQFAHPRRPHQSRVKPAFDLLTLIWVEGSLTAIQHGRAESESKHQAAWLPSRRNTGQNEEVKYKRMQKCRKRVPDSHPSDLAFCCPSSEVPHYFNGLGQRFSDVSRRGRDMTQPSAHTPPPPFRAFAETGPEWFHATPEK